MRLHSFSTALEYSQVMLLPVLWLDLKMFLVDLGTKELGLKTLVTRDTFYVAF